MTPSEVVTAADPTSTLGACFIDTNEDGTFGDRCENDTLPSDCYNEKADLAFVIWAPNATCSAYGNGTTLGNSTSGACCNLTGYDTSFDDNSTYAQCEGAFQALATSTVAACIQCSHDTECNDTRSTSCEEAVCDSDTRLCRCLATVVSTTGAADSSSVKDLDEGLEITLVVMLAILLLVIVVCVWFLFIKSRSYEDDLYARRTQTMGTPVTTPAYVSYTGQVAPLAPVQTPAFVSPPKPPSTIGPKMPPISQPYQGTIMRPATSQGNEAWQGGGGSPSALYGTPVPPQSNMYPQPNMPAPEGTPTVRPPYRMKLGDKTQ